MNYPVTAEEMGRRYEETNGCKMPEEQKPLWSGFADLLNSAYDAGVSAGMKRVQKASCK